MGESPPRPYAVTFERGWGRGCWHEYPGNFSCRNYYINITNPFIKTFTLALPLTLIIIRPCRKNATAYSLSIEELYHETAY